MTRITCVINCGTDNPKFPEFAKKMFTISDNSRDAEIAFFDNLTRFSGNMNKAVFADLINLLDEFKFFAKVKKQNIF